MSAAEPELQWDAAIGSNSSNEIAYSVLIAPDGGFIIAGSKSTPTNGLDLYLVKTTSNGTVEWEKSYGGYADDCANSLTSSSDGGYVLVGYTKSFGAGNSDVLMLKTDAAGEQEWLVTFGGSREDVGQSVQQTSDGGFIIAGGSKSFDLAGSYDLYLIATDSSGNMIWYKTYGGPDYDYANDVQQTSDGGFIVAGGTGIIFSYVKDILLIKTDPSGTAQWTKTFGGSGGDNAYSVCQTQDGGYMVAGTTRSYGAGVEDAYLIKTDAVGTTVWQNYYGGPSADRAHSAIQTPEGDYILVGSTWSYGIGHSDVYLVVVGASGNLKTMVTFGGNNGDIAYDIVPHQDGSCIIAGETKSFSSTLSQDMYLVRTNAFIDTLPPQITPISPASGSATNDRLVTITAGFYDAIGVDPSSVTVTLDSLDITGSCVISAEGFSYSPPSQFTDGTHTVSLTASDFNGNMGNYSWSFVVDSQSPAISTFTPANRSSTSSTTPLISASFHDMTGVNVSGVAARLNLVDISSSVQITPSGIQYLPPSPLGQGLHTMTLIVPDVAGNTAIVSWTFRVDATAPTISSISPSNGATIHAFGDTKVTISASYSDNSEVATGSIRLTMDGVDITSSATITATSLSCTRDIGPGAHTAQLTVVDGAGNISTSTVHFTVNNVMPFVIIAAIAVIALVTILLLVSRRKKAKPKELPEWERPAPPPPPTETYILERDPVARAKVEEMRYTPPLPTEQPSAPSPQPPPEEPKVLEEAPQPPVQAPGIMFVEAAPPAPTTTQEKAPEMKMCPECGKLNKIGASYCWYCDKSFE